ncbi:MAG: DNA-protecting protein DprA [Thermoleophilia bacterium]|nr:DNA-protecting protein DprA [Thermoleophilia bacterium]
MTGPGVTAESACEDCLRRSWLIAALAPYIQVICDDAPGKRTPELLRLDDEDLAEAAASSHMDRILSEVAAVTVGQMLGSLDDAACWACCHHDDRFPEGLSDGADAPRILIGKGAGLRLADLTTSASVTIVGARRATGYGLEVARTLGRELASAGLNVVSGMALGIDGAVHRGALEVGNTVAVLASGADRPYPLSHTRLYRQVLENGLVVSELPPGSTPMRWQFPARNRIMAALSGMTVVVEAAFRSGSLITAEMAGDAGREVGAVPGQVTIAAAAGTNELLSSGAALIRDGRDVIDRVIGVGAMPIPAGGPALDERQAKVITAVEAGCATVDAAADYLAMDADEVAIALARLEVMGYLACSLTGTYARTTQPLPPGTYSCEHD